MRNFPDMKHCLFLDPLCANPFTPGHLTISTQHAKAEKIDLCSIFQISLCLHSRSFGLVCGSYCSLGPTLL